MRGRQNAEYDAARAVIIANGEMPSAALLRRLCDRQAYVIATDGAAGRLAGLGLAPHVVLGDFDSLQDDARSRLPEADFMHAPDQEACDLEKAVLHALSAGYRRIDLAGVFGGRLDHTLTSLSVMVRYADAAAIAAHCDRSRVFAVTRELRIVGSPGDTVSLTVFAPACGVHLDGVQWPLLGDDLLPGSRGVSNVLTRSDANIRVASGCVVVCHSPVRPASD